MNVRRRTRLGEVLADQGRKKSWLADKLQVDRSTVTRWVKGDTFPTRRRRALIADLLGLSEAELFALGGKTNHETAKGVTVGEGEQGETT